MPKSAVKSNSKLFNLDFSNKGNCKNAEEGISVKSEEDLDINIRLWNWFVLCYAARRCKEHDRVRRSTFLMWRKESERQSPTWTLLTEAGSDALLPSKPPNNLCGGKRFSGEAYKDYTYITIIIKIIAIK